MGIFDKFRKKNPNSELKQLLEMQEALHPVMTGDGGVDADELPNGVGPFGFDATNPIPCKTTLGSVAYLERLHTAYGVKVVAERIGSFGSEVVDSPIDGYKLTHPSGSDLCRVTIPTRMVNVSNDSFYPLETSQRPFYQFLRADPKDSVLIEGPGHIVPKNLVVRETLDWFDQYLEPTP